MVDQDNPIYSVVESVIEPLVRADGGELYVSELSTESAVFHLRGKFSGCPGNTLLIRRVIEPALAAVAPRCRVSVSSGELLPSAATSWQQFRLQVKQR